MASPQPKGFAENSDLALLGVQELAKLYSTTDKNKNNNIPQNYIRHDQQPPVTFDTPNSFQTIPTIDMKQLLSVQETNQELQKLFSTCKEWGFFQLVNHGVSSSLLKELNQEIEEFFGLPLEEKMKYKVKDGDVEGYGHVARSKDQKLDWCDRFYMTINPIHRRKPHLLPKFPSSLRNTLESYFTGLRKIAMELLGLLGREIKMEDGEIKEVFEDGMQAIRMTYYPPCAQPELVMGITPHSDATGITILHQVKGVDGFQVKINGAWIPVKLSPDAFIVNIGDILEIMSNGAYKSIEHRVTINSEKERISIAMFFNPKFEAEIGPATRLLSLENPPLFKTMKMEDYVKDFFSRKVLNGKSNLDRMKINSLN